MKKGRPDGRPAHLFKWNSLIALLLIALLLASVVACQDSGDGTSDADKTWEDVLSGKLENLEPFRPHEAGPGLTWYQVFVYSFFDSDGDGIGDLRGVTERLDYIKSMGFDGIWLSPIHPSTTYHKYNVQDYYGVDPEYGTLEDFDALIEAADARGIRVILDLVLNHTDIDHPWFTGHPEYYNISEERGNGNWEQLPDGRWYECQFWGRMPDLNLGNPELRAELEEIFAFWLGRGVYGFRLDAIKDYYGNAPENIEALIWVNEAVKRIKPGAYLVGEVWDTTTGLYQYYESGVDSFFSFPFAGSSGAIATLLLNQDAPIERYLQQTADALSYTKALNPNATNAPFFTNHDMARAAGFLRRDPVLIKMAWGLSLFQPGDAFVYYGEELGMSGSGIDENKRAPMFWTDEAGAEGMTYGPPGMDEVGHGFPPAVQQVGDPESIWSYVREAVRLRALYPHIGRGSYEVMQVDAGARIGAVRRVWQGSEIVVVFNVSPETASLSIPGTLSDFLSATGELPVQNGDTLTLPGYTFAILAV